jgi:hypothetical protein
VEKRVVAKVEEGEVERWQDVSNDDDDDGVQMQAEKAVSQCM